MAEILWSKVLEKSCMPFLCHFAPQVFQAKKNTEKLVFSVHFGAIDGIRTRDLFLTKEVLYLLSYNSEG